MDEPKDREEALAGLLNGAVFTFLGGAFPVFMIWQIAADWQNFASGGHEMTQTEAGQGVGLTFISLLLLRLGLRMLRLNGAALRRL